MTTDIETKLTEILANEIELTRPPYEGLVSTYRDEAQRNTGLKFWIAKGMEVQAWQCNWNGIDYWGFSYNYRYKLSQKQKEELRRLKK